MEFVEKNLQFIKDRAGVVVNLGAGRDHAGKIDHFGASFDDSQYKTLDIDPAVKPDYLADVHAMPFGNGSVDAILAFNLLEHTHSPHIVVAEIFRTLKKNGCVLVSAPFIHPYHGGHCPDYYRFTKDGLAYLFRDFSHVEMASDGGFFLSLTHFVPRSLRKFNFIIRPLLVTMDNMITKHRASQRQYFLFAIK